MDENNNVVEQSDGTNALRFIYDTDTGLYYLQSRYYSPSEMCFVSQDDPAYSNTQGKPIGSNFYAYCLNNPVNISDSTGHISIAATIIRVATCVAVKTLKLSMAMYIYAISGSHFKSKLNLSNALNPLGKMLRNRLKESKLLGKIIKNLIVKKDGQLANWFTLEKKVEILQILICRCQWDIRLFP